jgi:hypothetical protein
MTLPWQVAIYAIASITAAAAAKTNAPRCGTCHAKEAQTYPGNAMSHALMTAAESDVLRANPHLSAKKGVWSYTIQREGSRSLYTVSNGRDAITVPLQWAFGVDVGGQTYVFERNGRFYESRVSYYKAIKGLDWTVGAAGVTPKTLDEAAGRIIDHGERTRCFGCHATHAVSHGQVTFDTLVPGVQCERCHVGAEQHRDSFSGPAAKPIAMKKLSSLSTEELSNFCGQCHRTWAEIAMNGPMSAGNVRFQPYRLTKSKCYDTEDKRIRCVACHDPHKPLDRVTGDYDAKCQACHAPPNAKARGCKVASKGCVSCHMPKVELPGSHELFTDHMIRIAGANGAYPE